MKNLTKKKTKYTEQKHIYSIFEQFFGIPVIVKEIFMCLLIIFILVFFYYICMRTYNFSNDNCELITVCTTNFVELESVNQPSIWYKYVLDDFFNKFISNKTINHKFLEIKPEIKTLMPLEYNIEITKKPVMLNKIQYHFMRSLISDCEFYKHKTYLLETELLRTKTAHNDLAKDINNIIKEMNYSSK